MNQYHVGRAACVTPTMAALRGAGVPIDRLLAKSGLHRFKIKDPNAIVPAKLLYAFLEITAREQTGPVIPPEISSRYVWKSMGARGADLMATTDLRTAVQLASLPEARSLSCATGMLETQGRRAEISCTLASPPGLARTWFEHLALLLMIDLCRAAAGPDWTPLEVHVREDRVGDLAPLISDRTWVKFGASRTAVVFPADDLALSMPGGRHAAAEAVTGPRVEQTLTARIETVLDTSKVAMPTLELLADLFDNSPRSMQRRLGEEGMTFFDVVDNWRCARALRLIAVPGVTVREISERLLYSDAAHFIRAFKRWTGVSPLAYREDRV